MFSALAAFTSNFDITNGLFQDPDLAPADELFAQAGVDKSGVAAFNFRKNNRLPRLNARGVSITLAVSRLLLLIQYAVGA
jgi:hypothetical protein